MKKIICIVIVILLNISFAEPQIPLKYNIIPDKNSVANSIIDSNSQDKLYFRLYANEKIYLNGTLIPLIDNKFSININNLTGYQELKFTNDYAEEASFTYYISDKSAFIADYTIDNNPAYIKTIDTTKVIYTQKDVTKVDYIKTLISNLPDKLKSNLCEIVLSPTPHSSMAAGITKYNKITLYNISSYTNLEIKRILFHEIAHTWAHNLRENKIIDYSYTEFREAVKCDNNFVSSYSKGLLSEDFADSIAYYLINPTLFNRKFPARVTYIKSII